MQTLNHAEITIKISVVLGKVNVEQNEIVEMQIAVTDYANNLVANLDIPVIPSVELVQNPDEIKGPACFSVSINNNLCRISLQLDSGTSPDVRMLMMMIDQTLVDNRLLFLTEKVIAVICEQNKLINAKSGFPADEVISEVIKLLVERCFRAGRCKELPPDTDIQSWSSLKIFDSLIQDIYTPGIRVRLNKNYDRRINSSDENRKKIDEISVLMQDGLYYELGVVFPKIHWEVDEKLALDECQARINDLWLPPARGLEPDQCLVNDTVDRLKLLNIEAVEAVNPANGSECAIVSKDDVEICELAGLTTWDYLGYIIIYVSGQLRRYAGSYFTVGVVKYDINQLRLIYPVLVENVLAKYDIFELTGILRDLADEQLSIRDLRGILDQLLLVNGTISTDLSESIVFIPEGSHLVSTSTNGRKLSELEYDDYSAYLRTSVLKRYLSHKYTQGGNTLVVYLLDRDIEDQLKDIEPAALSIERRQAILSAIHEEVKSQLSFAQVPVILTTEHLRRKFRKLIDVEFSRLAVLSYQELASDMNIQPIARIALAD